MKTIIFSVGGVSVEKVLNIEDSEAAEIAARELADYNDSKGTLTGKSPEELLLECAHRELTFVIDNEF